MKSILFLIAYPLAAGNRHHTQKYDGQMRAAGNLGFDVWYTGFKQGVIYLCHKGERIALGHSFRSGRNILQCMAICRAMNKIIRYRDFSVSYVRAIPCIPSFLRALKVLGNRHTRIIVEIPTYPPEPEWKSSRRFFSRAAIRTINFLFQRRAQRYVDLYTLIGEQAGHYRGVRAINIENCVDAAAFPLRQPKSRAGEVHLLALAKMARWHAYDRVIEGLRIYYSSGGEKTPVFLHLAGNDGDGSLKEWNRLAARYSLERYIFFEGVKTGRELDELVDRCDLGIGSLGLYRIGLHSASSIKLPEYCARGLPFVYSGRNGLLDPPPRFCLPVPGDGTPLNMEDVVSFARKTGSLPLISQEMREYAESRMNWEKQFSKIFDSLSSG